MMVENTSPQQQKTQTTTARFWVETCFLFIVLIFSMVQLVRSAQDRAVYFTLISGICGKIAKLKIVKPGGQLKQHQLQFPNNNEAAATGGDEPFYFDEVDGFNRRRRQRAAMTRTPPPSPPQQQPLLSEDDQQHLHHHHHILSSVTSES